MPHLHFQFRTVSSPFHTKPLLLMIARPKSVRASEAAENRQLLTLTTTATEWELQSTGDGGPRCLRLCRTQLFLSGCWLPRWHGLRTCEMGHMERELPCTIAQGPTRPRGNLVHDAGWRQQRGASEVAQRGLRWGIWALCGKLSWVLRVWWCLLIWT